jgi:hypothetical protein
VDPSANFISAACKILTICQCHRQKVLQYFSVRDEISIGYQHRKQIFNDFTAPQANFFAILGFGLLIFIVQ